MPIRYHLSLLPTHHQNSPALGVHIPFTTRTTVLTLIVSGILAIGAGGCGSSASDPGSDLNSRATAPLGPDMTAQGIGQTPNNDVGGERGRIPRDQFGNNDQLAYDQTDPGKGKTSGIHSSESLKIPDHIIKDLNSSDPHARSRALDYWETHDTQTTLDPVFDAMEDEDPAVRTKATTIIERHWAAEQERENG